jgi:hypothetical protein
MNDSEARDVGYPVYNIRVFLLIKEVLQLFLAYRDLLNLAIIKILASRE